MSFLSALDISASGMTAQRARLDVAAENIANIETTRTESGGPYRRRLIVLEAQNDSFSQVYRQTMARAGVSAQTTGGVRATQILEDPTELKAVYEPDHPDADEDGYVRMPNIDMVKEMTDGMAATRSYEANITAFNAIKLMAQKALEVGK